MTNSNYIDKLNQLENEFLQGSLDTFELQQAVFNLYKKEPKTVEVKDNVFNLIEKLTRQTSNTEEMDTTHKEDWMWPVFFESDKQMWGRLHVFEVKLLAEHSLNRYTSSNNDSYMLDAACSLARTTISNMDESSFTQSFKDQVRNVWLDVFKECSKFPEALRKEEQYWIDWRSNLANNLQKNIPNDTPKHIIESYTFNVPAIIRTENIEELLLNSELYELTKYIVEEYNNFKLEGYMASIGKDCIKSSTSYKDQTFTFKFEYSRKLDTSEIKILQEELRAQLSDGWGESIEQHDVLIDNELVSVGFDYERIKLVKTESMSEAPSLG